MTTAKEIRDSLLQWVFPHNCSGCGSDIINRDSSLCMRCIETLPETHFERYQGNPVEKRFWGRIQVEHAAARFYFTRESLIQQLMHQFKYKGNRDLGFQLGKMMGDSIKKSGWLHADALVPLPLFPAKEKRRGYNQATVLCEGMAETLQIPVLKDVIIRSQHTDTQTRKGRIERWHNMEGKFVLTDPDAIHNKHLLLVDDVITTGATLEACGAELLKGENTRLSIATLCSATR